MKRNFRILLLAASIGILLPGTGEAQEVFSHVAGRKANPLRTGETLHQYEFWIKPEAGAKNSTLFLFDAGIGGIADIVAGSPDTKTMFELFPFDSLYASTDMPLRPRNKESRPVFTIEAGGEVVFLNRWFPYFELKPEDVPGGWILRVRTTGGDDNNAFKLGLSTQRGTIGYPQEWRLLALDLSVSTFNLSTSSEIQIRPYSSAGTPPDLKTAGEEDADIMVRDLFGTSLRLKDARTSFKSSLYGTSNTWGLVISGSKQPNNNLVIKGVSGPAAWDLNAVVVQRPKPPTVTVQQLAGTSCNNATLLLSELTRRELAGMSPIYVFSNQRYERDTVSIDFPKPGKFPVSVLTPTRGMLFPRYWVKQIDVTLNAPPVARITASRTIAGPGDVVTLTSEKSFDPERAPLRYQWYVNGEFRSEEKTLTLSSLVPATYEVMLTVDDGAPNSQCTRTSDTRVIRVNTQPYAEIRFPLVFGRSDIAPFSVKREIDGDGDSLKFSWSGPGIVGMAKGRQISLKHDKAGEYELTLTVDDQTGTVNSTYARTIRYRVNEEPHPQFAIPAQAAPGNVIALSGGNTLDPDSRGLKYTWNISNGTTLEGRDTRISFEQPGDYTVTLTVDDGEGVANSVESYAKEIHINAPPVPRIAAAARSTSARQKISAEGTTDADQSRLKYVWDFGDGSRDSGKTITHVYQASGSYTIRLTVDDGQKQTNSVQVSAHALVINRYPVAQFTLPASWEPGTPLLVDGARSSDPDGSIAEYTWLVNGKETVSGVAGKLTFEKPGDYAVALKVKDNSGFEDAVGMKTLSIHINYPPTVRWKMSPEVAEPDIPVTFDASQSSDFDGRASKAVWNFSDGTTLTGLKVTKTFKTAGVVSVRITVDDGAGFANSTQSAEGSILVNHSPIIVTKTMIRSNSRLIQLNASQSYDADNDALSFDWILSDGSHRNDASFNWETASGGVHFVTVAVNDGRGKKNSITRETIRILVNRPPVAVVDTLVYACSGQTILFNGARSYDPDGDGISARWDFRDGTVSTETNPAHVYARPGYYPVTLALDDGFAEQPTVATIPIIVEGSPIAVQTFADTTVCVNSPITFSGTQSTDPNGPIGSFSWDFGDGINTAGSTVVHAYSKPGVYYAVLTVIGNGSGRCSKVSQATSVIHVVEGPVAEFSIPERISVGEALQLNADKSRPNGTLRNITWTAVQGDRIVATREGNTSSITFDTPGAYDVVLTISIQSTTNCNVTSLLRKLIVNAPPVLTWNVPADVALGDWLTLDASASSDPDGIITEFKWTLDGVGAGSTPVARIPATTAGTHTIGLTITDNSGTTSRSAAKTATVRVNSKPGPVFALPGSIFEGELVRLLPSRLQDADGDPLSFEWRVDGKPLNTDTVRFVSGRHSVVLIADDGRGLANSIDSIQREFMAVQRPVFAADVPANWIVGSRIKASDLTSSPGVGFPAGTGIAAETVLQSPGEQALTLGWAPKGELLATNQFPVTVWDSLAFTGSIAPSTVVWNPSNPSTLLTAPPVNRPDHQNVRYEWRKGSTLLGVGEVIEAPLTKGQNIFVVKAIDQDMVGANAATYEIAITCE